jgi:hypothetical protein
MESASSVESDPAVVWAANPRTVLANSNQGPSEECLKKATKNVTKTMLIHD